MQHQAMVYIGDNLESCELPEAARNPSLDVIHIITERISIEMVRTLRADALMKPLEALVRTFVLVAREWPSEAQNALLKLLEEPPSSVEFILVIPRVDVLLPTVRSRILLMTSVDVSPTRGELPQIFANFLALSYADRLELVSLWTKNKLLTKMEQVLRGAEQYAYLRAEINPHLLNRVVGIREYFSQPGSARKMLLEELALTLPVN